MENDEGWRPYLSDRAIKLHDEGFYVIRPRDWTPPQPLFCPICDCAFHTFEDEQAYADYGCCQPCRNDFVGPRMNDWNAGWRPSPEELRDKLDSRLPISIS